MAPHPVTKLSLPDWRLILKLLEREGLDACRTTNKVRVVVRRIEKERYEKAFSKELDRLESRDHGL